MKKIICKLNDNGTTSVNINGNSMELIAMTACILKDISDTLNMPMEILAMICFSQSKNIVAERESKENNPQADSDFNISVEDLQKLLNDTDGKEN